MKVVYVQPIWEQIAAATDSANRMLKKIDYIEVTRQELRELTEHCHGLIVPPGMEVRFMGVRIVEAK